MMRVRIPPNQIGYRMKANSLAMTRGVERTHLRKGIRMLVLSRTVGQVIVVGDDIRITVVEIRGDKVRIGVDAPRSVSVDREEIAFRKLYGKESD
tara:strand:+ start:203 stop:487 length:285 start_codon:yes stop_codon:yes gene_type:complete